MPSNPCPCRPPCPSHQSITTNSGQLAEVLNLVPWGGISLQFRHLRLFGMQGVGGVGGRTGRGAC